MTTPAVHNDSTASLMSSGCFQLLIESSAHAMVLQDIHNAMAATAACDDWIASALAHATMLTSHFGVSLSLQASKTSPTSVSGPSTFSDTHDIMSILHL
jgi:hypothetical protein